MISEFFNMEQTAVVKRLYVGGLGHTISEEELRERFGKFGKVSEIEIVTRKDEEGNPTKTFAYINITLSEKELKKCVSILNKAKWKGGTLQIELAKESFLHRLSRERQEASFKKEKPTNNGMIDVAESMKKSGVADFHVKAVPGTEIPNHKDWVVSKFGRVLPILHLKNQHKNKIIKYDPSKYCHNLKRLDQDLTETVPISQLTWHLEEEDDGSISKKRQGLFPVTTTLPKKKMRTQDGNSLSRTELNSCGQLSSGVRKNISAKLVQSHTPVNKKQYKVLSEGQKQGAGVTYFKKTNSLSESDMDSEEEFRVLTARERQVSTVSPNVELDDNMEVVGDNFELKYSTHWSLQNSHGAQKVHSGELRTAQNKTDYDSADTDEIIAVTKSPKEKEKKEILEEAKAGRRGKAKGERIQAASSQPSDLNGATSGKRKAKERAASKGTDGKVVPKRKCSARHCKSEGDKSSDSWFDTSESEGDKDYETLMQSCYRLELTLEDLGRLASKNTEGRDEDTESSASSTQEETRARPANNTSHILRASAVTPIAKKGICPEDILSALLEEGSDEEKPKKKRAAVKIQPFRGIGSLSSEVTKGERSIHATKDKEASSSHTGLEAFGSASDPRRSDTSSEKQALKSLSAKEMDAHKGRPGCHTSNAADHKVENTGRSAVSQNEHVKHSKSIAKTKNSDSIKGHVQSKNSRHSCKGEEALLDSAKATHKLNTEEKQLQDNEKRLIALQERQKEREEQKKLIQGALTSLESQQRNKQKHIVFDSDNENETEGQDVIKEGSSKSLGKEFITKPSGKLFESSDDESNTEDEDDERFRIKPQFEGKTGEKLMRLQSQFGTDERFRMDARFLESDSEQEEDASRKLEAEEEGELTLEKKKNLEILKHLVHIGVEPPKPTKQAASARKFKDMNALRYDPTRQDHAVFEKKPETSEKESKAKRKKKREEAQKMPEVSKEIFYDVAVNLKEVFGSAKHDEMEELPWDKHDDEGQQTPVGIEALNLSAGNNTQEESGGFTFSFFGVEEERRPVKEEPYVTETIKPARVVWQEDPRFQDSSSEDDETEIVQSGDVKEVSPLQPRSNVRFFFFSQDDDRLKEGPKLFCKSLDLDEDRDYWETRRQMLLEDCRKKHKDARRKVKAKQ